MVFVMIENKKEKMEDAHAKYSTTNIQCPKVMFLKGET